MKAEPECLRQREQVGDIRKSRRKQSQTHHILSVREWNSTATSLMNVSKDRIPGTNDDLFWRCVFSTLYKANACWWLSNCYCYNSICFYWLKHDHQPRYLPTHISQGGGMFNSWNGTHNLPIVNPYPKRSMFGTNKHLLIHVYVEINTSTHFFSRYLCQKCITISKLQA